VISDPTAALEVRLITADEYVAAGNLVVDAYITGGILSDDRGYDRILRDIEGRTRAAFVLVAVLDGQVVGTATIALAGSEHSEIALESESEFRYMGVRPDVWGRGIGSALVAASEVQARQAGANSVVISVIEHNVAGLAMYEKSGFMRLPERDWSPHEDIRLLVLRKALV